MGKRRRKRSGHWCWCCDRHRPNEKFSGRGHRRHLCRDCAKLGKGELVFRSGARNIDRLEERIMFGGRRKRRQSRDALRRIASTDADARVRAYAQRALSRDEARAREYRAARLADELADELALEAMMASITADDSIEEMTDEECVEPPWDDDEIPY